MTKSGLAGAADAHAIRGMSLVSQKMGFAVLLMIGGIVVDVAGIESLASTLLLRMTKMTRSRLPNQTICWSLTMVVRCRATIAITTRTRRGV